MTLRQQSRHEQMALELAVSCKERGCTEPVVGSSITGEGHVCRAHNEREWGRALSRSHEPYYRRLGLALVADSTSARGRDRQVRGAGSAKAAHKSQARTSAASTGARRKTQPARHES